MACMEAVVRVGEESRLVCLASPTCKEFIVYDSKAEMMRAVRLDELIKLGIVIGYERQIQFNLGEIVRYRADFKVRFAPDAEHPKPYTVYEEVKGFVKPQKMTVGGQQVKTGKLRVGDPKWPVYRRAWQKHGPAELIVITLRGKKWKIVERVLPEPVQGRFENM